MLAMFNRILVYLLLALIALFWLPRIEYEREFARHSHPCWNNFYNWSGADTAEGLAQVKAARAKVLAQNHSL